MTLYKNMVAGLIIQDHKLLLVHNTKYRTLRIEPPGGKKDPDENWEQAIKRELYEELGIKVCVKKEFGVYTTESPEGRFAVHMYFCNIIEGEPHDTEDKAITSFNWYTYPEIKQLKEKGTLVPNMCTALPGLKPHLNKSA